MWHRIFANGFYFFSLTLNTLYIVPFVSLLYLSTSFRVDLVLDYSPHIVVIRLFFEKVYSQCLFNWYSPCYRVDESLDMVDCIFMYTLGCMQSYLWGGYLGT